MSEKFKKLIENIENDEIEEVNCGKYCDNNWCKSLHIQEKARFFDIVSPPIVGSKAIKSGYLE